MKCNGLDLSLFQFDHDLTFAVFFFNADRTLYARYGTRSQRDADKDVALEGLAATMQSVLMLHHDYPDNLPSLKGKQPVPGKQSTPEGYPALSEFKPDLDYEGRVASTCIHCHQIRDAQRSVLRQQNVPLPDSIMFPYPLPETLGLKFDKQARSTVEVLKSSPAKLAGFANGDEIEMFNHQQIASEADFRWAVDQIQNDDSVAVVVNRDGKRVELEMRLTDGWRKTGDISWRPTSWDLRRMATGGMVLKPVPEVERTKVGVAPGKMSLVAEHVGQYGEHARAKKAGLEKGDVILKFDGRDDFQSESELLAYGLQQKSPGDEVEIVYFRDGELHQTKIVIQ